LLSLLPFLSPFCRTTAGHGEVYRALDKSGVLDVLLAQGREIVFISNVDNLGATVDLNVLYHLISKDVDFCMEVTDKTRGDVQGGTLVEYEGKPRLVELSQVPREHEQSFKSLKTFTCFNTNNLWANLRAIKELVASNSIQPPVVVNERTLKGSHILELETAAGAAISVSTIHTNNNTYTFAKCLCSELDLSSLLVAPAVFLSCYRCPRPSLSFLARQVHFGPSGRSVQSLRHPAWYIDTEPIERHAPPAGH
jgi:UDP-N-acetylglucosamine pyrophosphorylase